MRIRLLLAGAALAGLGALAACNDPDKPAEVPGVAPHAPVTSVVVETTTSSRPEEIPGVGVTGTKPPPGSSSTTSGTP
ncbi:hypothetical protein [Kutzneria buriramensis]|uniref:Uncharacterized protein n=1 Tax=Kutzneria buriramensis TaxID=1045776 RepID=A0A3E0H8S3_9PSEU|nr:hypothetical protein [Kutzneria buriramensis]REH39246.1 hypothetical protein BCF44_113101 [Kutzneria buriramensis]